MPIFFKGKLNVASATLSSSLTTPIPTPSIPSSTILSRSSPFIFNTTSQNTTTQSKPTFSMSNGVDNRSFLDEVSSLLNNTTNKMDVEFPLTIDETLNTVKSQAGRYLYIRTKNTQKIFKTITYFQCLIKYCTTSYFWTDSFENATNTKSSRTNTKLFGNMSLEPSYSKNDVKESPNTTPNNVSPILTPKDEFLTITTDLLSISNPSMGCTSERNIKADINSRQSALLSAFQSPPVVNNFNALLPQDVPQHQQQHPSNCKVEVAAENNSTSKSNNSLGMTLDDIMNMYRLKGNNHNDNPYMSETSSNASSCSSVCGWSSGSWCGGSNTLSGNPDLNTIFENKLNHANGKEKGNVNSRTNNTYPFSYKGNNNTSTKFGLESIPEYDVPEGPPTFQPLVPPAVIAPKPFSENISFPTTLQPRPNDRFDIWRSAVATGTPLGSANINQQQKPIAVSSNNSNTTFSGIPSIILDHALDMQRERSDSESYSNVSRVKSKNHFCIHFITIIRSQTYICKNPYHKYLKYNVNM